MPTETFTYTGSAETWTVPQDVIEVTIRCWGAEGGTENADEATAGLGGYVEADYAVEEGDTLNIRVGEKGSDTGGASWPNGGAGAPVVDSGSGGGSSDVRHNGDSLSDQILVGAGGGGTGGGGLSYGGGHGGPAEGQDGDSGSLGEPGRGGTQTSGGAGGTLSGDGEDGSRFQGGDGATQSSGNSGGGGGGGYYGGGGGSAGESSTYGDEGNGGGGGSNYIDSAASNTVSQRGQRTGDGLVEIEYQTAPPAPSIANATYDANDQLTLDWEPDTSEGQPTEYEIQIDRDGRGYVSPAGGPSTVTDDGSSTYSQTYGPHNSGGSAKDYAVSVGSDSTFRFRVRALYDGEPSQWTYTNSVSTTPIPPKNPSVSRPTVDTVRISATVAADLATHIHVQYREDTGDGYGSWQWFDTVSPGESTLITGSPDQAGTVEWEYDVGTAYQSGDTLTTDARYQFRLRTEADGTSRNSAFVYADYGNAGNVFFEDDFSSGDASAWDVVSGSATVTDTLDAVFSAGDNTRAPEVGGYAVEMGSAGYVQKNLGDLSGESDVHVRLRVQAASNDSASETGDLWWYDGSAWQTLEQWGWEYDGQGWMEYHALVPDAYLATDNRVRVGRDEGGGVDYVAFDEVLVADILDEYTQPAQHTDLSLDANTEGEIDGTWTVNGSFWPYEHGSDTFTRVRYRPTGSSSWQTTNVEEDFEGSVTLTRLRDGEEYEVELSLRWNQTRHGQTHNQWFSNDFIGPATAVTILPAPTGLSVDAVTADSVDLSWTDNHDYGDTRVEFKESDATSWTTFSSLSIDTNAETITGLLHGEEYDARVVAQTEHTETEDQ